MGNGRQVRIDLLRQLTVGSDAGLPAIWTDRGEVLEYRGAARAVLHQHHPEGSTATMICPKCSQLAEPDRAQSPTKLCTGAKSCDLYTVENGPKWVEGDRYLHSELTIIIESRERDAKVNR